MRVRLRKLGSETRAVGAVEFALVAPALFMLIIGIAQAGILFYAQTGLRHAVTAGARYATIYPRPTAAQVIEHVKQNRATLDPARFTEPVVSFGIANGAHYADVSLSYTVPVKFLFVKFDPITLNYSRRAFVPPPAGAG